MDRKSPHTVAHRRSLAYRIFRRAADSWDLFLGRNYKGNYLPTTQKHFTGISLKKYIALVCIGYPLVLLTSLLTWMVIPSTLIYMAGLILIGINDGSLIWYSALLFFLCFLGFGLIVGALMFLIKAALINWAESPPGIVASVYSCRRYSGKDPDFDDFPDKFPGPIALLKKWILSTDYGEASKITWDSGKKREGW